jgi:hypothetical protein
MLQVFSPFYLRFSFISILQKNRDWLEIKKDKNIFGKLMILRLLD